MPTSYHIRSPDATYRLTESHGVVTDSSDEIDWAITLPFRYFRDYCSRKGWLIIPKITPAQISVKRYNEYEFTIYWHNDHLTSIQRLNAETGELKEITYAELPPALKVEI